MKRRLSLPFTGMIFSPSILIHSPGLGLLRRVGVNQCPTTAAPITSVTSWYLCPSQANSTGHELPRRLAKVCAEDRCPPHRQGLRESGAEPESGNLRLPPVPTFATARLRRPLLSRPALSCYRRDRPSPGGQNDSCFRPRCEATPGAHSTASRSNQGRHHPPHRLQ